MGSDDGDDTTKSMKYLTIEQAGQYMAIPGLGVEVELESCRIWCPENIHLTSMGWEALKAEKPIFGMGNHGLPTFCSI